MPDIEHWKSTVDRLLYLGFAISIVDAGLDDAQIEKHFKNEPEPEAFVVWFAKKYDLIPLQPLKMFSR